MPTNIYILEDHPLVRKLLCEYIDSLPSLNVCGAVSTACEALSQVLELKIDLLLLDLSLPDMQGLKLLNQVRFHKPEMHCLVLSAHNDSLHRQLSQLVGVSGYITKDDPLQLEQVIYQVLAGETYFQRRGL